MTRATLFRQNYDSLHFTLLMWSGYSWGVSQRHGRLRHHPKPSVPRGDAASEELLDSICCGTERTAAISSWESQAELNAAVMVETAPPRHRSITSSVKATPLIPNTSQMVRSAPQLLLCFWLSSSLFPAVHVCCAFILCLCIDFIQGNVQRAVV